MTPLIPPIDVKANSSGHTTAEANTPSPPRHQPVTGDKREAIMNAALALFVERGFYGTAVPDIAECAAVGAGTIYRYFESKEALVNALYCQYKLHFAQVIFDRCSATTSREQFKLLWTRMVGFAIDYRKEFIFLELHDHARYLDRESHAARSGALNKLAAIVIHAQTSGELKQAAPQLLIDIIMGAFVGVIRSCIETAQPLASADWRLAEQCVWEAIRG